MMKKFYFLFALMSLVGVDSWSQNFTANFNGANSYIDLGNTVGTGIRTIEMWFKPNTTINSSLTDFSTLVAREVSPSATTLNEFGILFNHSGVSNSGALRFFIKDNTGTSRSVTSDQRSWNANQWYHVAAVIHPTQGMMLFIDGIKQINTNTYTGATTADSNLLALGRWGNLAIRYFDGSMDDVRFSSSAVYTANFTPDCPDLKADSNTIAVWNFNDSNSVAIAVDSSLNFNDGLLVNTSFVRDTVCRAGFLGNVLEFDGIDDFVDLGNSVGSGVRTVEMWFKPATTINSSLSTFSTLIAREVSPSATALNEFGLVFDHSGLSNSGALRFLSKDNSGITHDVVSNQRIWNANQWYHVAGVIHPTQGMMLFIDGVKQSDTDSYSSATNADSNLLALGRWGKLNIRHFNGRMDDVRLSSAAMYTTNFTRPCPDIKADSNTIAVWNFNDSSNVSLAIDSSGNRNSAQLIGPRYLIDNHCILTSLEDFTEIKGESNLRIYPNPSRGIFSLELNKQFEQQPMLIYNVKGQEVYRIQNPKARELIDLSEFPNGLYLIRFGEEIKKLMMQR